MSSGPTGGEGGYFGPTPRLQTTHTVTFEVLSGPTGRVGYSGPTPRLQTSHTVTFEVSSGPTGGELFQPHTQTPNYPHCYLWGVLRTHRGWAIPAPYPDSKLPTLTFEVSSGPTGGELFQPHTQTPNYPHRYLWGVLWAHRGWAIPVPYPDSKRATLLPLRCPLGPQGAAWQEGRPLSWSPAPPPWSLPSGSPWPFLGESACWFPAMGAWGTSASVLIQLKEKTPSKYFWQGGWLLVRYALSTSTVWLCTALWRHCQCWITLYQLNLLLSLLVWLPQSNSESKARWWTAWPWWSLLPWLL